MKKKKKVNGDENGRGLMTMMTTMAGGEERVGEVKKKKIDSGRLRGRGRKKNRNKGGRLFMLLRV